MRRILVVSQDAPLLRLMGSLLHTAGHFPAITTRPATALQFAQRRPCDLLVADLVMRPLGGDDLVCRLRARSIGVPALILAGRSSDTWARLLLIPRVMALSKPFTADEFAAGIEKALARWTPRRVA